MSGDPGGGFVSAGGGRFPIPLVGATAILLVLIVFTPILFATGPPAAGTFETQAELIVDQVTSGGTITFYVHAVGPTIRYGVISIGIATNFAWGGSCPTSGLAWSAWQNGTDVLAGQLSSSASPVVVQATATYTVNGATANYSAEVAFDSSGSMISSAVCFGTTSPASEPLDGLPLVLVLQNWGTGGPP